MRAPRPHVSTPGALACRNKLGPRCFTVINDENRQPTVPAIDIRSRACRRSRSNGRVAVGAAPRQPVGSGLGVSAEGLYLDSGIGAGTNGHEAEDQREPELSGRSGGSQDVLDMEDDDDFDTEEEEEEEEDEEEDDEEYVDEDDSLVAGMDGDLSDLDPYEGEEEGSQFVRQEGGGVAAVEELLAEGGADLSLERINRIFPYTLDKFQARAVAEILGGQNALVCAPTGAGKTAIAVAAAAAMLAQGLRVVYTTPLKALSNQKFFELGEMFGTGRVGLRTGDSTVNANADVVVMTTEILRNAMFSDDNDSETGAPQMLNVGLIVLDEVHYLGDKDRGSVWEEVIIACPDNVLILAMSATVQNPKDVGGWISGVHQPCTTIRTSFRPVPLKWHFCFSASSGMERTRIVPLLDETSKRKNSSKQLRLNPELLPPPQRRRAQAKLRAFAAKRGGGNGGSRRSVLGDVDELLTQAVSIEMEEEDGYEDGRRAWLEPRRNSVVREMADMDMLPAIWFIFSRKGCDDAVRLLHQAGVVLTTAEERADIDAAADAVRNEQPEAVREGLLSSLRAGLAAHHAGSLPAWKGLVESLFQRGLLKVVFATSTLAAGINMPARTTLISTLSLRRGSDRFTMLPHNELLQMAGRAGRRGFDTIGHCIILKSRHERVEDALEILRAGPEPLESQFTTGYGMVLNLIATRSLSECRRFVQQSFRAYLNSRTFSEERATIKKLEQQVEVLMGKGAPPMEDERAEMLREHQKLKALVKQERRGLKVLRIEAAKLRGAQVAQHMQQLALPALVLLDTQDHKDDDPRWLCLAADNRLYICTSQYFAGRGRSVAEDNPAREEGDGEPDPIISATYRVAESASTSWTDQSGGLRAAAGTVATAQLALQLSSYDAPPEAPLPDGYTEAIEEQRQRYDAAKAQQRVLRKNTKVKAGMKELRARIRRAERLKQRAAALSSALERQAAVGWQSFESVVQVLEEMGAVEKLDNGEYQLLPLGNAARELRCENELWLALCMLHPAMLPLTPPQFAGLIGALLMPSAINRPNVWAAYDCTPPVITALEALDSTMESFTLAQKRAGIDKPVEVDLRLAGVVEAWAAGCEWSEIMQDMSLDEGDVARLLNRICDVLRQLTYVDVLAAEQREKARTALKAMDRKPISEFVFTSAARNLASAL